MQNYKKRAAQVAGQDVHVIITGETGTGKEHLADQIQQKSPRAHRPYVRVHTAAIPETMIEAELFGYEKGSFTGAVRNHNGCFVQANTGTILLDEIGDMPVGLQSKLLRITQDGSYRQLGGTKESRVDVRIIALTHKDLNHAISKGEFRPDLYYRLSTFHIHLPPLRERKEEIDALVQIRLRYNEPRFGKKTLSDGALTIIKDHDWPGNVRELFAAIDLASVLCGESALIEVKDLELEKRTQATPEATVDTLVLNEKLQILKALEAHDYTQSDAAKELGISPRRLSYKLDAHGINHPKWRKKR